MILQLPINALKRKSSSTKLFPKLFTEL